MLFISLLNLNPFAVLSCLHTKKRKWNCATKKYDVLGVHCTRIVCPGGNRWIKYFGQMERFECNGRLKWIYSTTKGTPSAFTPSFADQDEWFKAIIFFGQKYWISTSDTCRLPIVTDGSIFYLHNDKCCCLLGSHRKRNNISNPFNRWEIGSSFHDKIKSSMVLIKYSAGLATIDQSNNKAHT